MTYQKNKYLSTRAVNCLGRFGVIVHGLDEGETRAAVKSFLHGKKPHEILSMENVGKKTIKELALFSGVDLNQSSGPKPNKAIETAALAVAVDVFKDAMRKHLNAIDFDEEARKATASVKRKFEDDCRARVSDIVSSQLQRVRAEINYHIEVAIRAEIKNQIDAHNLGAEASRIVQLAINRMSKAQ